MVRSARFVGVAIALAASIATTGPISTVDARLDVAIATDPSGAIVERRFVADFAGHPALLARGISYIEVEIGPVDAPLSSRVELVGPNGTKDVTVGVVSTLPDGGLATVPRGSIVSWHQDSYTRCASGPCPNEFVIRVSEATPGGVVLPLQIHVQSDFSAETPPPGEITIREVMP